MTAVGPEHVARLLFYPPKDIPDGVSSRIPEWIRKQRRWGITARIHGSPWAYEAGPEAAEAVAHRLTRMRAIHYETSRVLHAYHPLAIATGHSSMPREPALTRSIMKPPSATIRRHRLSFTG